MLNLHNLDLRVNLLREEINQLHTAHLVTVGQVIDLEDANGLLQHRVTNMERRHGIMRDSVAGMTLLVQQLAIQADIATGHLAHLSNQLAIEADWAVDYSQWAGIILGIVRASEDYLARLEVWLTGVWNQWTRHNNRATRAIPQ